MKKLGLIGGTGPESTIMYYHLINKLYNEKMEGKAFPELAFESLNLNKALGYVQAEKYADLRKYIQHAIDNLVNGGADIVALTAATMHIVYDDLNDQIEIPFISIPETVSELAVKRGYKKVGLLGTIFTMKQDYLKKSFIERGIEVITPSLEDMELVNERISKELEYGIVKETSVQELIQVITKMKEEDGIEAIILGCTELPLVLNEENSPVECLDIMQIHIEKLVELIME